MFQIETWTGTGPNITLFLIEMAAVTNVRQCGVCRQEYFFAGRLLQAPMCVDNNNNNTWGNFFYSTKMWNIYKYFGM